MNCKETTDLLVAEFGKQRAVAELGPDDFASVRNKMPEMGAGPCAGFRAAYT